MVLIHNMTPGVKRAAQPGQFSPYERTRRQGIRIRSDNIHELKALLHQGRKELKNELG